MKILFLQTDASLVPSGRRGWGRMKWTHRHNDEMRGNENDAGERVCKTDLVKVV